MKITVLEDLQLDKERVERIFSEKLGKEHKLLYFQDRPESQAELSERLTGADIAIVVNFPVESEVLSKASELKMISVSFTGYDHIDLETATGRGIVVTNVPEYATHSVTELVYGFLFSILRKLKKADHNVRKDWSRESLLGNELYGKKLGVIGVGNIGQKVARIGDAFGAEVLVYDYAQREELADEVGAKMVNLDTLLEKSDFITIHVPLNKSTRNLIGEEEIDRMKDDLILINAARGPIVAEKPLLEALRKDKIRAGLDVYHEEPLSSDHPITDAENTILTPHIGFYTEEALERRNKIAFENIRSFLKGEPENVVNPEAL